MEEKPNEAWKPEVQRIWSLGFFKVILNCPGNAIKELEKMGFTSIILANNDIPPPVPAAIKGITENRKTLNLHHVNEKTTQRATALC